MASVQTYLLTRDASGLQLHMPFSGTVSTSVPGGHVELTVRTGHPWAGSTTVEVTRSNSPQPWDISLRLPDWADKKVTSCDGQRSTRGTLGGFVRKGGQELERG